MRCTMWLPRPGDGLDEGDSCTQCLVDGGLAGMKQVGEADLVARCRMQEELPESFRASVRRGNARGIRRHGQNAERFRHQRRMMTRASARNPRD
jgi:hypothetical protein